MKRYVSAIFCCLVMAVASSALAADTVKFKFLNAVYLDAKGAPLRSPEGVACAGKSAVVVADSGNGRLVKYLLANDELKDGVEIKVAQLSYPIRVAANAKGELFVLDGKTRKIVRLAADGTFLGYLEPQNVPEPSAFVARSLATDKGDNIHLLDILGERVLTLDPAGKFLRQIPFPKGYGFFSDLNVDQRGNILILDSVKGEVSKAATDAVAFQTLATGLQAYLYFSVSIETDSQGRIFLLDQNDNAVILLGQDGSFQGRYLGMGWKGGLLYYPSQACVAEAGGFVIADRNNNRVQLFKIQ